jgi:hypothetical protein
MYLVACKWVANGDFSYKKPMDYFSSPQLSDDAIEYAIAVVGLGPETENNGAIVAYHWLEDADALNKITMTYYTDADTFNQWDTSATHTAFLAKRETFLAKTGITLQVVKKDVSTEADSASYDIANQLFS